MPEFFKPHYVKGGLVLNLHMDDIVSGQVLDVSGQANHGTIYGAAAAVGKRGMGLSFDGVNDYVINSAPTGLPTGDNPITLEAWFKVPSTTISVGYFVLSGTATNRKGYHLLINHPTVGKLFSGYWGAGFDVGLTGMNDGEWHYFVGTYDGTIHRTYVDGIVYDTLTEPGTGALVDTQYILGASAPASELLNGTIDEVRIYNRALTLGEIKQNFLMSREVMRCS